MNSKLYELMQEAGYAAPNLAPRASKLVYLVLDHLTNYTPEISIIAEEMRKLQAGKAEPVHHPLVKNVP